jgi:hypothetical protein
MSSFENITLIKAANIYFDGLFKGDLEICAQGLGVWLDTD